MTGGKWSNGRTARYSPLRGGPWEACADCVRAALSLRVFKSLPFGTHRCDDGDRRCADHAGEYLRQGAEAVKSRG